MLVVFFFGFAPNESLLHLQGDAAEDMIEIMQKLTLLKHNIADVAEPTQQLYNKFVVEESLK